MSRVTLRIGKLVLRGFSSTERAAIVAGLQTELSRTLAADGGMTASRQMPVLRLQLPLQPGPSGAAKLGAGIAGAVGRRLGK